MESSVSGRQRVLYPVELFAFLLNLIFCLCSLINIGKLRTSLFGLAVDRELLMGIVFALLSPIMLLFVRLANRFPNRIVQFFRLCYVQLLYVIYFTESIWLSQLMYNGLSFDPFFAHLDFLIFGFEPAIEFPRYFQQYRVVNEMFFFSYFFYYGLVTTGVWILYFRRKRDQAIRVLFTVSVSFFIMYVWFVFFPVQGPKYYFEELHRMWYSNFSGFLFTGIMKSLFNSTNLGGAAFPSSHVALALISLVLNWKYNRYLVPVYLPLTILLFLSTIYLYAHYFVDIVAGLAAGCVLLLLVPRLIDPADRWTAKVNRFLSDRWGFPAIAL